MSDDITVNATRNTVAITNATNLSLQLDNMSQQEATYYGGAGPYQRFNGYFTYLSTQVKLLQDDLLTDTSNVDPSTSFPKQYRIINLPERFPDGHVEVVCDLIRGK
jgi:hypothetical protein